LEEEVEGVTRLFRENLFQGVKATSGSVRMTTNDPQTSHRVWNMVVCIGLEGRVIR
jgi:hypothetical protein